MKERVNARGDETRRTLLIAAEKLFAERGIEAVPLRDIGIAAGQKNHAVVQYHFGDRTTLVRELVAFRAPIAEDRRVEMLADLLVRGRPEVADLVRVFVLPLAGHLKPDNHYLAFMSRYIIEHGGYGGLSPQNPAVSVDTLHSLVAKLLSDIPQDVVEERWMVTMTSTIHTMARYQTMQAVQPALPVLDYLDDLVRFLTAGLMAGSSAAGVAIESAALQAVEATPLDREGIPSGT